MDMLRRYIQDLSQIINYVENELEPNLSYEEQVLCILDCEEKKLCNIVVKMIWIQWTCKGVNEST